MFFMGHAFAITTYPIWVDLSYCTIFLLFGYSTEEKGGAGGHGTVAERVGLVVGASGFGLAPRLLYGIVSQQAFILY